ncbi:MAG: hypothetical protein RLZZ385_388 [Pseudomonadota bacterium]|jgi:predicted Zn-dependent protease
MKNSFGQPLRLTLLGSLLLLVGLTACTTSPTQRRQVVLYSDAELAQQGVQVYQRMRAEMVTSNNQPQIDFVQCVTNYIVAALDDTQRGSHLWEVTLFEEDSANAFALPGGKMGVYSGLLEVTDNQHQLAAVMAHEVGHVLARHSNERASQSTLIGIGRVVAQVAGVSDTTLQAIDLGTQYGLFLPFNRTQESEADQIGVMLMAEAGFDPREAITLWQNMSAGDGPRPPELLSTHPSPATRMADLARLMGPAETLRRAANARGLAPDCVKPPTL